MKLGKIPTGAFQDYRLDMIFDGYKWDFQNSTLSPYVLLLERFELDELRESSLKLYEETIAMERELQNRPDLMEQMGISPEMAEALSSCPLPKHVRFMRFDFHPTTEGWQISEVNSDVPAGYPEASVLPGLAQKYFDGYEPAEHFGDIFVRHFQKLIPPGGKIAYLHDTHTVEDYQILRYLGDLLKAYPALYTSPEKLKLEDVQGIIRYYPVEWLQYTGNPNWRALVQSPLPCANPPHALLTQSKRLPLIWDKLGINPVTWKSLLPKTVEAGEWSEGWILKPAFGRVGEGITVPGTMSHEENSTIYEIARQHPAQWVQQKLFKSVPLDGYHLTLGAFVINGEFGGLYGRMSTSLRIDEAASEIPILVRMEVQI